jgi:hypothetical protein
MTKRKEQQPKYKQSETVVIKRSQINFAPYNPRKEDPEVIKKLKKNFKTVGYLGGIVWNQLSSYLVSGHKRVQTLDIINNYDGTPMGRVFRCTKEYSRSSTVRCDNATS